MKDARDLVEGIDLAWWPTLLRNFSTAPFEAERSANLPDDYVHGFSASRENLAALGRVSECL